MARPLEPLEIVVAFSYLTDDREMLRPIADALEERLGVGNVFVDYFYETYLSGNHGRAVLSSIYGDRALLVVRCNGPKYGTTVWTHEEDTVIVNRIMKYKNQSGRRECHEVMDIWLSTEDVSKHQPATIHVNVLGRPVQDVVDKICEKLELARQHRRHPPGTAATHPPLPDLQNDDGMIDRTNVVRQVGAAVASANSRVVVVHGNEGTGKSTAIAQWLRQLPDEGSILLHTTAMACVAHARDLESLLVNVAANLFDFSTEQASDLLERTSTPICLVIDGINERGEVIGWTELIRQALESQRQALGLVIVTRSEHWKRIEIELTKSIQSSRGQLRTVVVPPFTPEEVRRFLVRFGAAKRFSAEVLEALRVPRLLEIAARNIDRLPLATVPTYATLQLLEFESRYGDDFRRVLAQRVNAEIFAAGQAQLRLDDYVEALRKTQENIDDLGADDAQVWVALGVWMRATLEPNSHCLHEDLLEQIEQMLGTSEHDARATILEYATTSALLDHASHYSIRIALIDRWLTCRNRLDPPARRLGTLLTIAPRHILEAIEKAVATSSHLQLADEFVDVLIRGVRHQAGDSVLERFRSWLGCYSNHYPLRDSVGAEPYAAEVGRLAEAATRAGLRVRKVDDRECELRTLALKVLLAVPDLVDVEMVRTAISAVAINARLHDTALLEWLLRRLQTDQGPLYARMQQQCEFSPELCRRVASIIWCADPVSADPRWVNPRTLPGSKIWYLDLADKMQDPDWCAKRNDPVLAHFRQIVERRYFDEAGMTLDDHALRHCVGGLAIHRPKVLRNILAAMSTSAAETPSRARNSQLAFLRQFAESLPVAAVIALRTKVRQSENAEDPARDFSQMDYWSIAQQRVRHGRRAAQVALLTRQEMAWGEFIDNAKLDADAAHAFSRRLLRAEDNDERDAWLFVLRYCKSFRQETRELLTDWLRMLNWSTLSVLSHERAEILAWRIDAGVVLAEAVENNANLSEIAGIAIAESPACTLDRALRCCSPSHWAHWCETHAATSDECRLFANTLRAIGTGEDLDALPLHAREVVDHHRARGADLGSCFDQQALRYWLAVLPDYLEQWLSADVGPILLAALAEAAVDRRDRNALPLVRQLWDAEFRDSSFTSDGPLRNVVLLAFRLPDLFEARALWREMLAEVRDDDELLRFVVSALAGNGRRWLRELVSTQLQSRLRFEHVRAAVIAGLASFDDVVRQIEINFFPSAQPGWIRQGYRYALEQRRLYRHATVWYARFRRAADPMIRAGAWLQLLRVADARFLKLELSVPLVRTEEATYHLEIHHDALRKAVADRQVEQRKTLLGATLPTWNTGWLARSQRRL